MPAVSRETTPLVLFCRELLNAKAYETFNEEIAGLRLLSAAIRHVPLENPVHASLAQVGLSQIVDYVVELHLRPPGDSELLCIKAFECYDRELIQRLKDESLGPTLAYTARCLCNERLCEEAVRNLLVPLLRTHPTNLEIFALYEHVIRGIVIGEHDLTSPAFVGLLQLNSLTATNIFKLVRSGFWATTQRWSARKQACMIVITHLVASRGLETSHLEEIRDQVSTFAREQSWDLSNGVAARDIGYMELVHIYSAIERALSN